ncbi:TonB-dependent siderophore receptor [Pigmentiphaga litoralis]|uniref:Outer membrane receptor protein involved in Fe transport n=1 Tax=Pigmentiphaga litoralis TaxID=516702 RepID=A0A7Y9IVA8_9BURK|nr:TonB-dependent receptor [Pigmentiphaga litoralis]NYE22674.1 outer membrane receptor protein involved in Fe transport [Pigmentiphaga litoralis]NYE83711.1 outer membrane receptor protein involved in Fe transport [Pigmentiphaga litoralis]
MAPTLALALTVVLAGCAPAISLKEDPPARSPHATTTTQASIQDPARASGKVYYATSTAATPPDYAAAARDAAARDATSAAVAFPVAEPGVDSPVAPAPQWNPDADGGVADAWGSQRYGRSTAMRKSDFEFEQKLDDTWSIKQSLRYGRPSTEQGNGLTPESLRASDDGLLPGLGTFNLGTHAMGKFTTVRLQHQFKFGFDYLKARDIYETRVALAPSLDIFDPAYGAAVGGPRAVAQAYAEKRQLGLFVQDQVTLDKWTMSLVGRRDQLTNRTIDLGANTSDAVLLNNETVSGRIGLKYQFDNGLAPYMNYSNTYAPVGGSEFTSTASQQYETGVRYVPDIFGKVTTLSAFNQIQNNSQTTDTGGGCGLAGCQAWAELRVRGAAVESKLQPLPNLRVVAAYMVTNSSVMNTSDDAYSAMLANRFPTVSEQQVSVRAKYAVDRGSFAGLSLDGRVGHTGASYGYAGRSSDIAPSYMLVDAGVNYDFGRLYSELKGLQFRASASNLLDKGYVAYCYTDSCSVGAGRSVSAIVNYQMPWP